MKLKTLKDLLVYKERWMGYKFVLSHVLKQEAIKWVKDKCPQTPECKECKGSGNWIKHFFNITEEDLK